MPAGGDAKPRAAVLGERGLSWPGALAGFVEFPLEPAPLVADLCLALGARQLWLGPSALRAIGAPARRPAVPASRRADAWRWGVPHHWLRQLLEVGWQASAEPAGLAPWVELRRDGARLDLALPSWDESNPFAAATSAGALLEGLRLFAEHVGIRYRRSPGSTGLALMHAASRIGWPESYLPPPALEQRREPSALWLTSAAIPAAGWLHAYDLNGQFLAACSSAELGFGQPEPSTAGQGPGYWLARVSPPKVAPWSWPLPFLADGRPRWYVTPALQLARELGLTVTIAEGWAYPERHRWLEPWYRRLRDAREQLLADERPAAGPALDAVKAVYRVTIGRLAGGWLEAGDQQFRPDWRDAVIARARANLHRHLARAAAAGWQPVALNADAVIYHHADPDPVRAAADIGLELSPQLGKWKHLGSVFASSEAARPEGPGSPLRRARRLFDAVAAV